MSLGPPHMPATGEIVFTAALAVATEPRTART